MAYAHLLYEPKDRIGVITLNRPEKLNALHPPLWKELGEALQDADQSDDADVLILTGAGRSFCVGDDISVLAGLLDPKEAEDLAVNCIFRLVETMIHMKKPLIAAVNGFAMGGGFEIVLLCDLAISSDKAAFSMPEGRVGAVPLIFAVFGPWLVGRRATNELTMLANRITPQTALDMGLISRVVPHEQLMDAAMNMAKEILHSSPLAIRLIKQSSSKVLGEHLYDFYLLVRRSIGELMGTEDFLEGARAFTEGRSPKFVGR